MSNQKEPPTGVSRRKFMGTAAAAAGVTIVPRHVLGAGFQAPSDTVNVAVVGYKHGMGTNNLLNVARTDNIVALCDCDESEAATSDDGDSRHLREVPEGGAVQGLPPDVRQAEGHRRGGRRHARSQPRHHRVDGDAARQARLRPEAADAHHQRSTAR